jgi:hypothetical protein
MSQRTSYLLDADSFIRSKREHYAFDFCPAYWDALLRGFAAGLIKSIEPIRKELLRGKDSLANWIREETPEQFFDAIDDPRVQSAYADVIQWSEGSGQFTRPAKQAFASGADPWLIAFAATFGHVLVTYEVSQPTSKALIKLPDAGRQFDVKCVPPYVMLRELKVRFQLAK